MEGGWVLTAGHGHRLHSPLTTAEQRLLRRLFIERDEPVERQALVEALGEYVYEFDYAHLVSRLRRRAKKVNMVLALHAIRAKGFAFTD